MCHHPYLPHEQTISAISQAGLLPLLAIPIDASPKAQQVGN